MAELMDLMDRFMEEVFDWRVFCGIVAAIIVFIIEIRLPDTAWIRGPMAHMAIRWMESHTNTDI